MSVTSLVLNLQFGIRCRMYTFPWKSNRTDETRWTKNLQISNYRSISLLASETNRSREQQKYSLGIPSSAPPMARFNASITIHQLPGESISNMESRVRLLGDLAYATLGHYEQWEVLMHPFIEVIADECVHVQTLIQEHT